MDQKVNNKQNPGQEKGNRVSIWLATAVPPDNYFVENCTDDNQPFNQFSADFGIGFYDHDFVEVNDSGFKPVEYLLSGHSYANTFLQSALAEASKRGMKDAYGALLMYNIDYNPNRNGKERSDYLQFLGCFDYAQCERVDAMTGAT
jgi:hypothetical protein